MSKADVLFVNMCEKILKEGFSSEGQTVRARWEDGRRHSQHLRRCENAL